MRRFVAQVAGVAGTGARAVELVWGSNRALTGALAVLTLAAGVLPAVTAWLGKKVIDSVVAAATSGAPVGEALIWVAVEAGVVVALAGTQRGIGVCQQLLRALMGHRVNVLILEKALQLELRHFEDSEFYDRLTQARREASSRPLSLVTRSFGLVQNAISLVTFSAILLPLLTTGGRSARPVWPALFRGRGAFLGHGLSAVYLAFPGDATPELP